MSDQKTYCHMCLSKLIRTPYGFACKKCGINLRDPERERAWNYLFELKGADKQDGEAMQKPKTHLIVRIWRWLTCKE
ncbi:MAG: hypothetical protein LBQ86_01330 [Holophagales bacterium]|jgi:hypothetical protein|nr:hypothetical protein [Holophagales bacterium]